MITLVIGGASSGKTRFALHLAEKSHTNLPKAYIATAQVLDDEMRQKVLEHQAERSKNWQTFEEPLYPHQVISNISKQYPLILLDCLTMWLANMMMQGLDIRANTEDLINVLNASAKATDIVLVTNEVGLSIVPDNQVARLFRQEAGILNQKVSAVAHEVYFVISGIPMRIK